MTPERWPEVDRILDAALDLPPHRRAAFLEQACAGEDELRLEVETLLQAHDQAEGFIETPPATEMADLFDLAAQEDLSGQRIGPYQLMRELGRGGMGVVYLAARADDEFRKQVAVKLVGNGPQNTQLMRRFRRERQILASLDHPNIARLLDGGRTEQGWPYLVMEYVEGAPINTYCHQRRLSISARLKLFREVCQAVQYAHQNLVIHRDLKPSNILVTPTADGKDGVVKLLDFGIAKLLHTESGAITQTFTTQLATGALMMTPEYASPEQVRGELITTASDVYSLGVVLYELLAGQPPYVFKDRSLPELVRVVCEEEPEPPSVAVMTNAQLGQQFSEARLKLRAQLRGDPDQIVMMALQKDVQLRYRSVEQLGEDARRHLEGKPIAARPSTWPYRAGKFIRRYKAGVTLATLLVLTLIGGIVVTAWQVGLAREQARANRRLIYTVQMTLAKQAWEMANTERARELLEGYLPRDGEEDLRGFEWYYLWRHCRNNGEIFNRSHPKEVWGVAFAPGGGQFATACDDGKARLWDVDTGKQIAEFSGHEQYVWAVAFSPDGRRLATGSGDQTVKLWDTITGRELATFKGHTNRVGAVTFAPDGKTLVSCSRDNTVKLWDVATGKELMTMQNKTQLVWGTALAFAPDGKRLAVGRRTFKFDNAVVSPEPANSAPDQGAWAVTFSPDGKMLAIGEFSKQVKLWEVATGRELAVFTGHTGEVYSVAFSSDGRTLASASGDYTVKLWDVAAKQEIAILKGHSSPVHSVSFSPDGKRLVTVGADRTARLWDVAITLEPRAIQTGETESLKSMISPDGKKLVTTSSYAESPMIWDATSLRELVALGEQELLSSSAVFSPDGKTVATNGGDRTAQLWDAVTGQELLSFSGHRGYVLALAFSPDGRKLVTSSSDKTVKLWDVATGKEMITLRGHAQRSDAVAFAPNGEQLATGSFDAAVRLWEVATGRELAAFKGHASTVQTVAFSPDGMILASGGADSLVKLWRLDTGQELAVIKGHSGHVAALAFSPDGKRLVTGGGEGLVRLWDLANGQELIALRAHAGKVNSVSFSADGRLLASSGADGAVRLWRAATAQEVAVHAQQ